MSFIYQKPPNNYTYLVGISNSLDNAVVPITLTGIIAETNMQSMIVPARTFVQDAQVISIRAIFTSAVLTNGLVRLRLNGTEIVASTRTNAAPFAFTLETYLIRQGTTLVTLSYIFADLVLNAAPGTGVFGGNVNKFASFDFNAQMSLVYSAALPNAGQSLTEELCYCSIQ